MTSITHGVLVAYTVNKNDLDIKHPYNRLLIKPYSKMGEDLDLEHPNFILVPSKIYGTPVNGFQETVKEWIDRNWNDKMPDGEYKINQYRQDFYFEEENESIEHNKEQNNN